jgi:hypothetical protein
MVPPTPPMKSSPWYSTERIDDDEESPLEPVYHDNTACKQGKLIDKNFRRYGTDNRSLCKRCTALNASGR